MRRSISVLVGISLLYTFVPFVYADEGVSEAVIETATSTVPVEGSLATTTPEVVTPLEQPLLPSETILVKFADASLELTSTQASETFAESENLTLEEHIDGQLAVLSTQGTEDAETAIERLEDNPLVEYAEPNYPRSLAAIETSDTHRALQWALENTGQSIQGTVGTLDADIDAVEAWTLSTGTSTLVAVIDTGVLYTHGDLAGSMWDGSSCVSETGAALGGCQHGYDYEDTDLIPLPTDFPGDGTHGTHVAGIIAAQMDNATGTIGVAPSAKIMALKFGLDVASEVKAIDFAIQNGAKVINASYGGADFSQAEYDAIARFRDAGGIFVAAAGNDTEDNDAVPQYPASYDLSNIISVAATDQNDALASFSNYGATTVDIGAPGRYILSTATTDGITEVYAYLSGTSMSTPHVAGTVALMQSLYPDAEISTIKNALLSSGDSLPTLAGATVSGKRLNAYAALQALDADDVTPPVITLTGSATIELAVGEEYIEQGATALDETDGVIPVTVTGSVDANAAGTYIVTYNAVDQAGNQANQVGRTVTVTEPARRGGGGGGGGGRNKPKTNPSRTLFSAPGAVLGATTFAFTTDRTLGSAGSDVTELQNALTRLGFYQGPVTSYLGPLTSAALQKYQAARGISVTGVLDAQTRLALNKEQPSTSGNSVEARIAAIIVLLQELKAQLALLKAGG